MKRITGILAALLCLLLLAACGAKTAQPDTTAAPAPVAPPDDAPVVSSGDDASAPPADASPLPAQVWPITVTDDMGRAVTLEAPPERVAVLIGSFAETWMLAGGELIEWSFILDIAWSHKIAFVLFALFVWLGIVLYRRREIGLVIRK